jgi:hypothetical protein
MLTIPNQQSRNKNEVSLNCIINLLEAANQKQLPKLPKIMSITDQSGQKLILKQNIDISINKS